jgi:hypothetical protein
VATMVALRLFACVSVCALLAVRPPLRSTVSQFAWILIHLISVHLRHVIPSLIRWGMI